MTAATLHASHIPVAAPRRTHDTPSRPAPRRWPTWGFRCALLAWAGFWCWFVVADGIAEGLRASWPYMLAFLVPIAALTSMTLKWPRLGGGLLAVAGIAAAYYFRNPWALGLFALPPVVLGVTAVLLSRRRP